MLWLIKVLIFGHLCVWEQIEKPIQYANKLDGRIREEGVLYICKCKKCGRISRFKIGSG